ncbi:MAG: M20/M25/M40 family metallo-hydrolase [Candidatus Omnitrophota bacterium]
MLVWLVFVIPGFIYLTTFGWRPSDRKQIKMTRDEEAVSIRLRNFVNILAEEIGVRNHANYDNLEDASSFIYQSFAELGYPVQVMSYKIDGKVYKNLIAVKQGVTYPGEIIIIGAHYDSCYNPGADDNASGVAGLLELARQFKNSRLNHTVKFIAFVNEEPPFFHTVNMGSYVYTRQAKAKEERIKGSVILEMIGYYSQDLFSQRYLPFLGPFYPNQANFISIVGNLRSRHIANFLYRGFRQKSDFPIEKVISPEFVPGIYYSDHWSFWKMGYPAVMVTDTAFLRNRHYHRQSDKAETLNFDNMTKVVYGLKEAILNLDRELVD